MQPPKEDDSARAATTSDATAVANGGSWRASASGASVVAARMGCGYPRSGGPVSGCWRRHRCLRKLVRCLTDTTTDSSIVLADADVIVEHALADPAAAHILRTLNRIFLESITALLGPLRRLDRDGLLTDPDRELLAAGERFLDAAEQADGREAAAITWTDWKATLAATNAIAA
jgi:hypothetical protein